MESILQDFHLHSGLLEHTQDTVLGIAKIAALNGYSIIAFTEHFCYPFSFGEREFNKNFDTIKSEKRFVGQKRKSLCLSDYCLKVSGLKEKMLLIKIVTGLEIDYFPKLENKIYDSLQKIPLDYCLGAVHYIKDPGNENYVHVSSKDFARLESQNGTDFIYESYFSSLLSAIKSGSFDCIAHIDYLKKKFQGYSEEKAMPFLEQVLEEIVKYDLGLEVNTKGYFDCGENYPSAKIVEKFIKFGGKKIVVGSDSHSINEFKQSCPLVKSLCKKYQEFLWKGKE